MLSLIMKGLRQCSGNCVYCSAVSNGSVNRNSTPDDVLSYINHINEKNKLEFKLDAEKLENRLNEHRLYHGSSPIGHFTLWGADPLTAIDPLRETVDFLKYYTKKYNLPLRLSSSTNGLPFVDPERVKFCIDNRISIQFSHDGIGEELRLAVDPIYSEGFKDLAKKGLVNINCLLHAYNYSVTKNIAFFENAKKINGLENVTIRTRFSRLMTSDYNLPRVNETGFYNGSYLDELKGKPFGDIEIRNDRSMPNPHALDDHIEEMAVYILKAIHNDYIRANYGQVLRVMQAYLTNKPEGGHCALIQKGERDWCGNIDTGGSYTQCNLLDSDCKVRNPENKKPEECKTCRFKDKFMCTECGQGSIPTKPCECNYRMLCLYESIMNVYGPRIRSLINRGSNGGSRNGSSSIRRPEYNHNKCGSKQHSKECK